LAVNHPKNLSVRPQQNFSENVNNGVGAGSKPAVEIPPTNKPPLVVMEAPLPPPPSQPITTTITTKIASPEGSKPLVFTTSQRGPGPSKKVSISPPKFVMSWPTLKAL